MNKTSMLNGTIKTIKSDKGFFFITPTEGGDDVFAHRSALAGVEFSDLAVGQAVTYALEPSPKGLRAGVVERL
jgi:CspA family cold shock protein